METREESFPCHQARTKLRDEGWRWFSDQIKITLCCSFSRWPKAKLIFPLNVGSGRASCSRVDEEDREVGDLHLYPRLPPTSYVIPKRHITSLVHHFLLCHTGKYGQISDFY